MAITTFNEVLSAISNWHVRSNIDSARAKEWIAIFEACANRRLRVRQMEASASVSVSASGIATLPTDFLQWRAVTWTGTPTRSLEYADRTWIAQTYADSPAAPPEVFTIEGSSLAVMPTDSARLILNYYQKIPALSTVVTSNWLLTAHPDIYVFGPLLESNAFIRNAEMAPIWKSRRDEVFDEIVTLHSKSKSPAQIRLFGVATP